MIKKEKNMNIEKIEKEILWDCQKKASPGKAASDKVDFKYCQK